MAFNIIRWTLLATMYTHLVTVHTYGDELTPLTTKQKELAQYDDLLVPNLGVAFKSIRALFPTKDEINFNLHIRLPNLQNLLPLLVDDRYANLSDKCQVYQANYTPRQSGPKQLLATVCYCYEAQLTVYTQSMERTRLRAMDKLVTIAEYVPAVTSKLDHLRSLLSKGGRRFRNKRHVNPSNVTNQTKHRPKRFLDLIFAAANTAMNIYRTVNLENKLATMRRDIENIQATLQVQENFMLDLSKNLQALASATAKAVSDLQNQIDHTNARVDQALLAIKANFDMIVGQIAAFHDAMNVLQFAYSLQTHINTLFHSLNDLTSLTLDELSRVVDGFHTLHRGRLPHEFVKIDVFQGILNTLNEDLAHRHPGYELLSTNAIDYYELDSIIWIIKDYDLLLNIPIPIKQKVQEALQLYRVESYHIPYDIAKLNDDPNDPTAHQYTKIELDYRYFAVGTHSYVLLHDNILHNCLFFAGYQLCGDVMIRAHKTSPCCLSMIYYQNDMDDLTKHCNIRYYRGIIPPPLIFEDSHYLLLTNVAQEWRFACRHPFPEPRKGKSYSLIEKHSLCGCEILIGSSLYVARKVQNCGDSELKLSFHYPINSVVVHALESMIGTITTDLNYFKPMIEEPNFPIPPFDVKTTVNQSQVLYANDPEVGVEFHKVIDLIKSSEAVFRSESDMIKQNIESNDHFEKWFTLDKVELAITFCLGLIGLAAAIGLCIVAYKQCGLSQWTTAVLASQTVPGARSILPMAKAMPPDFTPDQEAEIALSELRYRGYLILATIITYLGYKLLKYLYHRFLIYRVIMPGIAGYQSNQRSHFYLEVASPKGVVLLYLITVSASMINIAFHEKLQVTIASLERNWFSTILKVQWKHGVYRLFNDVKCSFPTHIPVPLLKRRDIIQMYKDKCHVRLLIHEGVFYDYHAVLGKFKPISEVSVGVQVDFDTDLEILTASWPGVSSHLARTSDQKPLLGHSYTTT